MISLIVFIVLFFSNSCRANKYPDWYNNKPDDNKLYIYSIGEGDSESEAIRNALDNIIKMDDIYVENIHINFPDYNLLKNEKYLDKYYILLNVKRNELFNLQMENLKIINDTIEHVYADLPQNPFEKISQINLLKNLIEEAKEKINIAKKINNFDDKKIIKRYNYISNNINKNVLDVRLVINNDDLLINKDVILAILQNNNIKINDNSNNILLVDLENKNKKIHNTFVVNTKIMFKIIDVDGNVIKYIYKNYMSNSNKSFQIPYNENFNLILKDLDTIFGELIK